MHLSLLDVTSSTLQLTARRGRGFLVLLALLLAAPAWAQLTGTLTVPGTYPTVQAAIADLNAVGVGAGGVIFDVAPGHTETFTTNLAGTITATGTAANPITFRKAGVGANPVITAGTGVAGRGIGGQDGIIILVGSDYVTFDGINLIENGGNASNNHRYEYGFSLRRLNAINGSQNNAIRNCSVTLNKVNGNATVGIGVEARDAVGVALPATNATGANSNNVFISNTFANMRIAVRLDGTTGATLADINNEVGQTGLGNTATNIGGTGAIGVGVYALRQSGLKVVDNSFTTAATGNGSNNNIYAGIYLQNPNYGAATITGNTINLTANFATAIPAGIQVATAVNPLTISGNTITTTSTSATAQDAHGIISTGNAGTILISGNNMTGSGHTGSGSYYGVRLTGTPVTSVSVTGNFVQSTTYNGTADFYGLYRSTAGLVAVNFTNNQILNNTFTSVSGDYYGIANRSGAASAFTASGNTITNQTLTTTDGDAYGIHSTLTTGAFTASSNTITGLALSSTDGFLTGISAEPTGGAQSITGNTISALSLSGTGDLDGIDVLGTPATSVTVSTNTVQTATTNLTGFGGFYGIYTAVTNTTPVTLAANQIINNAGLVSVDGPAQGILNAGASAYTAAGNTISGNALTSTTGGMSGIVTAPTAGAQSISGNTISSLNLVGSSGDLDGIDILGTPTGTVTVGTNTIQTMTRTGTGDFYGIYSQAGVATTFNANQLLNNTALTTIGDAYGLFNGGSAAFTATNNIITTLSKIGATGGVVGLFDAPTGGAQSITGNTFTSLSVPTTSGTLVGIYLTGTPATSVGVGTNIVQNCTRAGGANNFMGIRNQITNAIPVTLTSNQILNNTLTGTGDVFGIFSLTGGNFTATGNTVSGTSLATTASNLTGIYSAPTGGVQNIGNNTISALSVDGSGVLQGIFVVGTPTTSVTIGTNTVQNMARTGTGGFSGIHTTVTNATPVTISGSQILTNTGIVTTGDAFAIFNDGASAFTASGNTINGLTLNTTAGFLTGILSTPTAGAQSITGNTISALNGNGSGDVDGIDILGTPTTSVTVGTNTVQTTTRTGTGGFFGIFSAVGVPVTLNLNQILNNTALTTSGGVYGIRNEGGADFTATTNTINTLGLVTTVGSAFGISAAPTAGTQSITGNTIDNLSVPTTTGTLTGIDLAGTPAGVTIGTNIIQNSARAGGAGISYGIRNEITNASAVTASSNQILTSTLTTDDNVYGIYSLSGGDFTASGNTISGLTLTSTVPANFNALLGIYAEATAGALSVTGNTISSLSVDGDGDLDGIDFIGTPTTTANVSNNIIQTMSRTGTGDFYGVFADVTSATPLTLASNQVLNNTALTTTGTAYGFLNVGSSDFSATNNTITTLSKAGATGGIVGLYSFAAGGQQTLTGNTITGLSLPVTTGLLAGIFVANTPATSVTIGSNTVQNCSKAGGANNFMGIRNQVANATPVTVTGNQILNNTITTPSDLFSIFSVASGPFTATGNTISGNSLTSAANSNIGIYTQPTGGAQSITGNTISALSVNGTGSLQGVRVAGTPATSVDISTNTVQNMARTGSGSLFSIYYTHTTNVPTTVNGNQIINNTALATSGSAYGIFNGATIIGSHTVTGNLIKNLNKTVAGATIYGILSIGDSPTGSTENISNNRTWSLTGAGNTFVVGIGALNGLTSASGPVVTIQNNSVKALTSVGGSVNGMRLDFAAGGSVVSADSVVNLSAGDIQLQGLQMGGANTAGAVSVARNVVAGLTGTGANVQIIGITASGTTGASITADRNKVYNLASASTLTGAGVIGINSSGTLPAFTATNNVVGNLTAPVVSSTDAIRGMSLSGTAGGTVIADYNTVYLNATSTGTNFGTAGIIIFTNPTVTLRNNLVQNLSTPNGTGFTSAHRRSSTTLGTFAAASNNNLWFAGTPGGGRVIYLDGSFFDQTLAQYKTRVGPRDAAAVTEAVPFSSTTGSSASFLSLDPTQATQAESGGVAIGGLTDAFNGTGLRTGYPQVAANGGGTAPDIGAWEGDFSPYDLTLALTSPVTPGCYSATEPIVVTVTNLSAGSVTLGPNRVLTVAGSVTRPTAPFSVLVTGSISTVTVIAPGGTLVVPLTPGTVDMTDPGVYTFSLTASITDAATTTTYREVNQAGTAVTNSSISPNRTVLGTTTWLGTNPNWYDQTNWTACVPSPTVSAIIPATAINPIISTGLASVKNLTITTTAVLTLNGTGNLDVYGAFTTASGTSFVATVGTTTFKATAPVVPAAQYFNVALVGATPKTLTGAASIYGDLDLTGGGIDLGAFDLTLDPPTGPLSTITGASASGYVITDPSGVAGQLVFARTGGAATARQVVFFPIGTAASYTPARLTLSNLSSYVAAARGSVSDVVPIVVSIDPSGTHVVLKTWDISWGAGTLPVGETGSLQLRWNAGTDQGSNFDPTLCTVAHFIGGAWNHQLRDYSAVVPVGGQSSRTRNDLTTFSPFAVEDYSQPLPVELTRFTAVRNGKNADLSWTTASEKNSRGFHVQVSLTGRPGAEQWRTLGFVASPTPTSTAPREYRFTDTTPDKVGTRFYRLQQEDIGGGEPRLSLVQTVEFGAPTEPSVEVAPNPFAKELVVRLATPSAGPTQLWLTDALGRQVFAQTIEVLAGSQELRPTLPANLTVGTYVLGARIGGRVYHLTVVKE